MIGVVRARKKLGERNKLRVRVRKNGNLSMDERKGKTLTTIKKKARNRSPGLYPVYKPGGLEKNSASAKFLKAGGKCNSGCVVAQTERGEG